MPGYTADFRALDMGDLPRVGGKNASLAEMIRHLAEAGVSVPGGFATTTDAFHRFLRGAGLEERIVERIRGLPAEDVEALSRAGAAIRDWILSAPFPADVEEEVRAAYRAMCEEAGREVAVAVRSSATAEDLPDASFAGQQETYLNVRGEDAVVAAVHKVFASLFTDRAISYRRHHGFDVAEVAISAGVQEMVRADLGASGVLFTLDTESGFPDVVFITASWGLGELVVQGAVNPDEFHVHKQTLEAGRPAIVRRRLGTKLSRMVYAAEAAGDDEAGTGRTRVEAVPPEDARRFCMSDADVHELARQALAIERHYGRPMDIEWAKDGESGEIRILQARPETVESRSGGAVRERYRLEETGPILVEGRAIGQRIGQGPARVIASPSEIARFRPGDVLVTDMTDPDWEPIMKQAAAIVTNRGGRTCHAAIIARELGVPAVVGCGDATSRIPDGVQVTVSCAEGDQGVVYDGALSFARTETRVDHLPELPLKVMMNVGNPEQAFSFAMLPHEGVGLARLEFLIEREIGVHPRALLDFDAQPAGVQEVIRERMAGYDDPVTFYVERLKEGIATLAAAFSPHPVIVRLSDFKSNEYANLVGGPAYEPTEENPMLGFRGASRYVDPSFRPSFDLECRAVRRVREEMGFRNVWVMIPFVRTIGEAEQVVEVLAENGLRRGEDELRIIMMCEVPSNAILADRFLDHFDGFSIGSNDLTQLTLGLDRDSGVVAHLFDERDAAVKALLSMAIRACRARGKYIGICGQGPSDHPDLAEWLLGEGIGSLSLNPDTVVDTWLRLASASGASGDGGAG